MILSLGKLDCQQLLSNPLSEADAPLSTDDGLSRRARQKPRLANPCSSLVIRRLFFRFAQKIFSIA